MLSSKSNFNKNCPRCHDPYCEYPIVQNDKGEWVEKKGVKRAVQCTVIGYKEKQTNINLRF